MKSCNSRAAGNYFHHWIAGLTLFIMISSGTLSARETPRSDEPATKLGALDIARIQELHHLTDLYGDKIWPGFDTRKIPIAVNNDDREEMLIGHPRPPKAFHPFRDFEIDGQPVMIMDGITRYGPKGGGWAVEIGGKQSAYVSTLMPGRDTEGYLSLILHECFHCFQRDYRRRADGAHGQHPEVNPVYSALLSLESRVLKAALDAKEEDEALELAMMFVAVRHERRKSLPEHLILLEGEEEYRRRGGGFVSTTVIFARASSGSPKGRSITCRS